MSDARELTFAEMFHETEQTVTYWKEIYSLEKAHSRVISSELKIAKAKLAKIKKLCNDCKICTS